MPIFQVAEVGETIEELVKGRMQWADVTSRFPLFSRQADED